MNLFVIQNSWDFKQFWIEFSPCLKSHEFWNFYWNFLFEFLWRKEKILIQNYISSNHVQFNTFHPYLKMRSVLRTEYSVPSIFIKYLLKFIQLHMHHQIQFKLVIYNISQKSEGAYFENCNYWIVKGKPYYISDKIDS